ncbi:MAG: hypothetical protein J6D10_00800, partial [Clostridia bacterium]|nr:hypothetical protein [Clostridia bacterium]
DYLTFCFSFGDNRGRNFLEKVPSPNPIFKNFQNELDCQSLGADLEYLIRRTVDKICIFFVIFFQMEAF